MRMRIRTFILIPLFVLIGCAGSVDISKPDLDLQKPGPDEGILVGSILLDVADPRSNLPSWVVQGTKTEDLKDFEITFRKYELVMITGFHRPTGPEYQLHPELKKEMVFAIKVPAGHYDLTGMNSSGILLYKINFIPFGKFSVFPMKTTYVGKLVMTLPYRARGYETITLRVVDAEKETLDKLEQQYQSQVKDVVNQLMDVDKFKLNGVSPTPMPPPQPPASYIR